MMRSEADITESAVVSHHRNHRIEQHDPHAVYFHDRSGPKTPIKEAIKLQGGAGKAAPQNPIEEGIKLQDDMGFVMFATDDNYYFRTAENGNCENGTSMIDDEAKCIAAAAAYSLKGGIQQSLMFESSGCMNYCPDKCSHIVGIASVCPVMIQSALGWQNFDGTNYVKPQEGSSAYTICRRMCYKSLSSSSSSLLETPPTDAVFNGIAEQNTNKHTKKAWQVWDCPKGFFKEVGDSTPEWGDIDLGSYWGARHATTPAECGEQCVNTTGCESFKWSPRYRQGADPMQVCVLSKQRHITTTENVHDFVFCTQTAGGPPVPGTNVTVGASDPSNPDDVVDPSNPDDTASSMIQVLPQ